MDILKEIKEKVKSNSDWSVQSGVQSVVTHIEIAERYHFRAKSERDEHLYTDVIYRTNHAFEGILKEAYVTLANKPADQLSPHEIEEYLLAQNILKGRVIDLLKNYRQNWRNPSTHDYQLFFSEQESFLAIVTVSALLSILLDQMLEKHAYIAKFKALENEASLARDRIKSFENLAPIDKVWKILLSYADHYIKNFKDMSEYPRTTANAQMAAFIKKVAPDLTVEMEPEVSASEQKIQFDLSVIDDGVQVVIETREPMSHDPYEANLVSEAAIGQLSRRLYATGLHDGVVFFYPGYSDDDPVATTSSTAWPKDLNLKVVYSAQLPDFPDEDYEEPIALVD